MRTARARPSRGTCSRCSSRKVPVKRMVFHEITREAIQRAVDDTREIDTATGRRAGDPPHPRPPLRLRGQPGAVAQGPPGPVGRPRAVRRDPHGRRARARAHGVRRCRPTGTSRATSRPTARASSSRPGSSSVDGARVATGRDFADDGDADRQGRRPPRRGARARASPRPASPRPRRVTRRPGEALHPPPVGAVHHLDPPAGGRRASCGCRSKNAMRVAQRLYENGYITYMRTDSHDAVGRRPSTAARSQARDCTAPSTSRTARAATRSKVKNAQEAHEAIRPAGDRFRTPAQVARSLRGEEFALYDLIWKRTVASQMADARGSTATVKLAVDTAVEGAAVGRVQRERHRHHLPGFLAAYEEGRDDEAAAPPTTPPRSAGCRSVGRASRSRSCAPRPTATRPAPPARYTEATLVKAHGGARHRPPVDLCRDDRHDPGPRLRLHQGPGARADVARLRRDPPARGALRRPRRLRVHRLDGGGPRPHRQRRRGPRRRGSSASTSARRRPRPPGCAASSRTSARSTPRRSRRSRIGDGMVVRVGRYGPYVEELVPAGVDLATGEVAEGAEVRRRRAARRSPTTSPPTR